MARAKKYFSEAALAEVTAMWLESMGFECYFEVPCLGGVADIVAIRGRHETWIVETKMSFCLPLIDQCLDRIGEPATVVVAAVPHVPHNRGRGALSRICRHEGIGVIVIGSDYHRIDWTIPPRLRRVPTDKLRARLIPEYRDNTPGTSGKRITVFSAAMAKLAQELVEGRLVDVIQTELPALRDYRAPKWRTGNWKPTATERRALAYYLECRMVPGWTLVRREGQLWVSRVECPPVA